MGAGRKELVVKGEINFDRLLLVGPGCGRAANGGILLGDFSRTLTVCARRISIQESGTKPVPPIFKFPQALLHVRRNVA